MINQVLIDLDFIDFYDAIAFSITFSYDLILKPSFNKVDLFNQF